MGGDQGVQVRISAADEDLLRHLDVGCVDDLQPVEDELVDPVVAELPLGSQDENRDVVDAGQPVIHLP